MMMNSKHFVVFISQMFVLLTLVSKYDIHNDSYSIA